MAAYKYFHLLQRLNDPAFDQECRPGTTAQWPGIYRCVGCGAEIVAAAGASLPAENQHRHPPHKGPTRWQLVVSYVQPR